jgi:DNA polymerase
MAESVEERRTKLEAIATEVKTCVKCDLYKGRTHAVPGSGSVVTDIMFIGEGPGYHEDKQGLPFVGQSGKYLDELLASIGLARETVFITNVVKCRPPENRDPLPKEIEICTTNYLFRQIEIIQPKLIATLGRFSMGLFLTNARITKIHGQAQKVNGRIIYPLFHPAAVLRNQDLRGPMQEDFKRMLTLIQEIKNETEQQAPKPDDDLPPAPKQLSLF